MTPDELRALTARLTLRFGPEVAAWCADVPALAARLAARWDLTLGEPYDGGASSLAIRCTTSDGTPGVLKLTPDAPFLATQVEMLRSLAPSGRVPRVFAHDGDAVVLEAVVPGTEATPTPEQWAGLMSALHSVEPPAGLERTLRGRLEEAFARIGRRLTEPKIAAHLDRAAWDRAIERCERLLDTQTTVVLLHGDLHPGNVLDGGARGLVAIDPKTCVGDPCFDAMDYVVEAAGAEGVGVRCRQVAAAYGLDPDRLFEWSRVNAPLYVIGHLTWGGPEQAIDELLTLV
ncbi:streptomycin 6-kinase [Saccharothrix tamanrassetensis]|uniref:Streptomycin 6-kinase n=1 Tax=Saccharothrix tamanrassetensis TaxID=1051531 RepID=A0A841CGA4_9PSEU|nr:phosphotransferase [Saccharothrix tamanrassetensis]MBB5955208.1 streptomycin 6-kinase [Saccharothrix tamanrassetensis]